MEKATGSTPSTAVGTDAASRTWEPMTLTYVGNAGDVLEGGGGKQSPIPEDMGDIFKPPGKG